MGVGCDLHDHPCGHVYMCLGAVETAKSHDGYGLFPVGGSIALNGVCSTGLGKPPSHGFIYSV